MKFRLFLIVAIAVLAAFLRFYALDKYPAGLNADEAAIGYNAYSLIQTGKDEEGHPWPITFVSFGDYKPGLYFYLCLPFVKALGLNIWAVRLPSAILGTSAVVFIFLIARELEEEAWHRRTTFPYLAAFCLAVSPWHIFFSRGGWEANAATSMLTAGVYFFLVSLRHRTLILLSSILFILSMYTYQSTRLIAPVLGVSLVLVFFKKVFPLPKRVLLSCLLALLLLAPLAFEILSASGLSRFSGVGLTADLGPISRLDELRNQHAIPNQLLVRILHNKAVAYAFLLGKNYLDHFSGNFLFVNGDPIQRDNVPQMGQLYLIELPFLLVGAWVLIKKTITNFRAVSVWLLVAPLAAALTFQTPHALRAENMAVPLAIVVALGIYATLAFTRKNFSTGLKFVVVAVISVAYLWNAELFLNNYFIHYPQTYPFAWEYGFSDLATYLKPRLNQYRRILITDKYDQPYIEMLFYLHYPPQMFQKEMVLTPRDKFGFSTVNHFANFSFQPIVWSQVRSLSNTLIVAAPGDIPGDVGKTATITSADRVSPVFEIVSL